MTDFERLQSEITSLLNAFGIDLNKDEITKSLDACLLNMDEMDQDWSQFNNPYGWQIRAPY